MSGLPVLHRHLPVQETRISPESVLRSDIAEL